MPLHSSDRIDDSFLVRLCNVSPLSWVTVFCRNHVSNCARIGTEKAHHFVVLQELDLDMAIRFKNDTLTPCTCLEMTQHLRQSKANGERLVVPDTVCTEISAKPIKVDRWKPSQPTRLLLGTFSPAVRRLAFAPLTGISRMTTTIRGRVRPMARSAVLRRSLARMKVRVYLNLT